MRIALIHYAVSPVIGGVESVIAAHARLFTEAGHEVTTIARRGNADHLLQAAEPTAELGAVLEGCDVVIVHNVLSMPFDMPLTEALWQLSRQRPGTRWIGWVHDLAAVNPDYDHPWHLPPWDCLTRASPHFNYVAVSKHRADQFTALTGATAEVIPNGVEPCEILGLTPEIAALCRRGGLLEREIVLIHPTRLLRRKNVEFGLEVLAELRSRGRDAATVITAAPDPHNTKSPDYALELRSRRDALALREYAPFVGDEIAVSPRDLVSLYALADALFFPSRQEGFGLPVLEAALHRLPIFVADVRPLNSLLEHGVHAFASDCSAAEVAHLIERTLDRHPGFRSRRETLRRYAWSAVWSRHLVPLLEGK